MWTFDVRSAFPKKSGSSSHATGQTPAQIHLACFLSLTELSLIRSEFVGPSGMPSRETVFYELNFDRSSMVQVARHVREK